MKPSKRNNQNQEAKNRKLSYGKPKISKYAKKRRGVEQDK